MRHKRAPLHAIEVALHKAAVIAHADGVDTIIVGNGADSNFGGMDKLLSRDWSFDAFVARYTFVDPARVLTDPRSMRSVFAPYELDEVRDALGRLFALLGYPAHNPFAGLIQPGDTVFIKPNWVAHRYRASSGLLAAAWATAAAHASLAVGAWLGGRSIWPLPRPWSRWGALFACHSLVIACAFQLDVQLSEWPARVATKAALLGASALVYARCCNVSLLRLRDSFRTTPS